MNMRAAKYFFGAAALSISTIASSASIMVTSTSEDTVGQSIVYNLRNKIAQSSLHKIVYTREQAGFIIAIVTLKQDDGSAAYSAVLLMPPFDKKGFDYYVTSIVGYCGSNVTERCGANILASFDQDMTDISTAVQETIKKK